MNNLIKNRIGFIIDNFSEKEKDMLLFELIGFTLLGKYNKVVNCVQDWEETAEINSDPKLKNEILSRYKSLKGD